MSKEKKLKYDIKKNAKIFGNIFIAMGILMLVGWLVADYTNIPLVTTITFFIATVIGIPYLLIKVNSKKYKL